MRRTLIAPLTLTALFLLAAASLAQPATAPAGKLPYIAVDTKEQEIRVECEMLRVEAPLEFFCVTKGSSEHESVLRTRAKPSDIHLALLMLGLEPGEPVKYSEAAKKWFPPHGPPLGISVEFQKDGKAVAFDAHRLMRGVKDKKEMPSTYWIFAGSRMTPDNQYAADVTGYVVSIVNFDLTLIDIPEIKSNANETLEWELNAPLAPPLGSAVTIVIKPTGAAGDVRKSDPAAPTSQPGARLDANGAGNVAVAAADIEVDEALVRRVREQWNSVVRPHSEALKNASQTQYEVIAALRREQQRLIEGADRIQRVIDELEREYQDMTTPRPRGAQR